MKILLIQLFTGKHVEYIYPLGLAYLCSSVGRHDVKVVDQNLDVDQPFHSTEHVLHKFTPDVVGISIRNIHIYDKVINELIFPLKYLVNTIKIIKKTKWNIPIIAGGAGFSMYPRQFMTEAPEIKYGVFLEGEESFPQLLDNLDFPYNVKGIFIRDKNEIVFTGERSFVNFENSIIPDRTFMPFDNCKKGNYSLGVQSKRGCSLQCLYCSYPYLNGSKLKLRDPEDIVTEIEDLCHIHGVAEFAFADNVFNIPVSHAEKICKEIIKRGINVNWTAWFNEQFMDERFVDLCLEAGCRLFEFSPDGFSNKSLRWLRKNIQTCHIQNTYNIARKKNMEVSYNFMIGIPGQGPISLIRQTIFILKAKIFLGKKLKGIQFSKLGIEPSTALAKLAIEEKKISLQTDLMAPTFYSVGIFEKLQRIKKIIKKFIAKSKQCNVL